ncbi:hypothetical protein FEN17_20790 [Dyadobacter luticola]|uniref:Uncharacterized protein n=2 Tax=Dyadobacter luticola TaxID=1979387 RepID=A0A5R9KTV9_9BACT|nr:hypothetical protein FEN17_20790 [Dyadobacter luticola]
MGFTNREEQEQVRQMMLVDRELETYVADLEADMRGYFAEDAVMPPAVVRELIELRSQREKKEKHQFDDKTSDSQYLNVEVNDTHIKVHKNWRPAFIAVFILSKIFLIAGLYFYFKSVSQQEELQRLKTQIEHIK